MVKKKGVDAVLPRQGDSGINRRGDHGRIEAVTSRRAVRGFTDQPVSRKVLERVLSAAAWSPSGSNIQPWNSLRAMTGALLAELKTRAVERVAHGDAWDQRQYEMYPPGAEVPVRRAPIRLRAGALQRTRHCARGLGGAPAGGHRQLELFRRARRPVLLHRPRPGPGPNGPTSACICRPSCCCSAPKGCTVARRWRGRRFAETVAEVLSPRTAHPLLRHVDRLRGPHGKLTPARGRAPLGETVMFVDGPRLLISRPRTPSSRGSALALVTRPIVTRCAQSSRPPSPSTCRRPWLGGRDVASPEWIAANVDDVLATIERL